MTTGEKFEKIADIVYDKGKADGDKALWDAITGNNTRTNYIYGIYRWLGVEYLHPPYQIKVVGACDYMISFCDKLKKIEKEFFDLSGVTGVPIALFRNNAMLEEIEDCGLPTLGKHDANYLNCNALHTIELIRSNVTTTYSNTFNNCHNLANVKFEGEIGQNISFQHSPLSKASITNIFEHLSTTTSGTTLTLKKTAVNAAFGIDVDDENTYPEGSEYYTLRHSRDNWSVGYA